MKTRPAIPALVFLVSITYGAQVARFVQARVRGGATPLPQQSPPNPQIPGIHVEVRQVLVPIIVTDAKGHSVLGLRSSDFRVFEDGVEQNIVSFTPEADGAARLFLAEPAPAEPGVKPIVPAAEAVGSPDQTYLVVLDTLNSEFGNFAQVRGALKSLFSKEESGSSLYGLVALSRTLNVVEPLTRDPTTILGALEDKHFTKFILESKESSRVLQEIQLRRMLDDYCLKCECQLNAPGTPICENGLEFHRIEAFAASSGEEDAGELRTFLQQLRGLAAQLGAVPGRRTLILISDGFTIQPGRNLFSLIAIYLNDPQILQHNSIPPLDSEVNALLQMADDRNVVFYTLDSRGVYVTPPGGIDVTAPPASSNMGPIVMPRIERQDRLAAVERDDGLVDLAESTGGLFFGNSNNLLKGLRQALADGRSYYVLAYNSSNKLADGKFRKIEISVDQKNVRLRAKRGYWAPAQ